MDVKLFWLPAAAILAGCASTVDWQKPGTSQAAVDADVKACQQAAQAVPTLPRQQTAQPSGALSYPSGSELDADRQFEQARRLDECMRGRGYQLVRK
jgi:hypothetical protein